MSHAMPILIRSIWTRVISSLTPRPSLPLHIESPNHTSRSRGEGGSPFVHTAGAHAAWKRRLEGDTRSKPSPSPESTSLNIATWPIFSAIAHQLPFAQLALIPLFTNPLSILFFLLQQTGAAVCGRLCQARRDIFLMDAVDTCKAVS